MSYTYATYSAALAELMVTTETSADFVAIRPSIIDYAEQRIYRELDLLSTVVRDSSSALTSGVRSFNLPTSIGTFVTVAGVSLILPSGTAAATGTRVPLTPVSRETLDFLWPASTMVTAQPQMFAMVTQAQIIIGPTPDESYIVEVTGTQRPAALSVTNTTTFLSQYLPDLFIAASMVFASGYMRNFGSQGDDPKMSVSWEQQYQTLKMSAMVEELRKKFMSTSWSSQSPAPTANPARN